MNKTKLQLYNELKELTEESREQIKAILDDIVESGVLSAHVVNIPECLDLCSQFNMTPKKLKELLDAYLDMQICILKYTCNYRKISMHLVDVEDGRFYKTFHIAFCPLEENIFLWDAVFCLLNFSSQQELKNFIENYVEYKEAFTEYLCDNCFVSADIYSDGFYELVTVKELALILEEYEKFFKDELDKLKSMQVSLNECENKLNEIFGAFKHRFSEYLEQV